MLDSISVNAHSSIRIADRITVYVDPFRIEDEPHDADLILFTHPHYDHFSPEDFRKLAREDTLFVCPLSMKAEALAAGIRPERLNPLVAEENLGVLGIEIEAVPAYNIGKDFHPKEKGWLGSHMIYIAGDTDAVEEARAVSCDIALGPIGGTYTMTAEEAARLVNTIRPHTVIPTHYGCIVGSLDDARRFVRHLDRDVEVCLKIG